jgi:GPH family glycoside/pentoside/hexuronide:cation symporter
MSIKFFGSGKLLLKPKTQPTGAQLLLFSSGDFAFNLFWQSAMLFLLYYYTDVLGVPIATAAAIFTIGAVWDGFANFAAGLLVDRRLGDKGKAVLIWGALPLALGFGCAYLPPLARGSWGVASLLVGHLLFRTIYAAVNVPYLAMSARISVESRDRAFIAGARMLFGTAAAVTVALGTVPLGSWLTSSPGSVRAFVAAAAVFAIAGTIILFVVGCRLHLPVRASARPPASTRRAIASIARNRAFVSLLAAVTAMVIAATVLNKSVLYFFKYALGDPRGGELALASMAIISAVAVPCWMLLGRRVGLRAVWLLAAAGAGLSLLLFAAVGVESSSRMYLFLIVTQAMIIGLHFAFWAMLPNTIEYGERATGMHVEGLVFGMAALMQRLGIGVGTALLGWTLGAAGYVANTEQEAATLGALRWTIALTPLVFLALSCAAMLANPLARGVHRRIVRELEARGA